MSFKLCHIPFDIYFINFRRHLFRDFLRLKPISSTATGKAQLVVWKHSLLGKGVACNAYLLVILSSRLVENLIIIKFFKFYVWRKTKRFLIPNIANTGSKAFNSTSNCLTLGIGLKGYQCVEMTTITCVNNKSSHLYTNTPLFKIIN